MIDTSIAVVAGYSEWLDRILCVDDHITNQQEIDLYYALKNLDCNLPMPEDASRVSDGKGMRWKYVYRTFGADTYIYNELLEGCGEEVTCLEVLLAIAENIDMFHLHVDDECHLADWFWLMLHNMTDQSDGYPADYIVSRWMERGYAPDGSGGNIFVRGGTQLYYPDTSIWLQLNDWCIGMCDEFYS